MNKSIKVIQAIKYDYDRAMEWWGEVWDVCCKSLKTIPISGYLCQRLKSPSKKTKEIYICMPDLSPALYEKRPLLLQSLTGRMALRIEMKTFNHLFF